MRLIQILKALNPLAPKAGVVSSLSAGKSFGESLKEAAPVLSKQAARRAQEKYEDGPIALWICLYLEELNALLKEQAQELAGSSLSPRAAKWSAARVARLADSLSDELFTQHVTNAVLEGTGLHAEQLIIEAKKIDVERLAPRLAEVFKQSLSSLVGRQDLAVTAAVVASRPSAPRLARA
jgi:hypothetical protein